MHQVAEPLAHVGSIHHHGRPGELLGAEGHVLEHLLHDREEAAGTEVLVSSLTRLCLGGELADAVGREIERDLLGAEQAAYCLVQRIAGLGEDPDEIVLAQGLQFDTDGESTLETRGSGRWAGPR